MLSNTSANVTPSKEHCNWASLPHRNHRLGWETQRCFFFQFYYPEQKNVLEKNMYFKFIEDEVLIPQCQSFCKYKIHRKEVWAYEENLKTSPRLVVCSFLTIIIWGEEVAWLLWPLAASKGQGSILTIHMTAHKYL